jgi:H+/Cl- antiporter ClcA/CBS domain-containing protein
MTTKIIESSVVISSPAKHDFSTRLTSFLNRWQPAPEIVFLLSAFLIGATSGLGIILFHFFIDLSQNLAFKNFLGIFSRWGAWTIALVPILGGLLVGIMRWLFPKIFGQNLFKAIEQAGGTQVSPWRPLIKMLAAAVSLGSGASLGSESPSVEIGASMGALLGQSFQVSHERYRLFLGAGAAAGLAAGFHTPITGVFFALEVVLGAVFTSPSLSIILLAAVVSDIVSRSLSGGHPSFYLPTYNFSGWAEGLFFLGLGLLASLLSLSFTQAIQISQRIFAECGFLANLAPPWKPVIGGMGMGLILLGLPEVSGIGYGTIDSLLAGRQISPVELTLLGGTKLVATALCLGSGFVGGIFAPAMFLGGCLGTLYAQVLGSLLPVDLAVLLPSPTIAAMVGLAAVLAGSAKAPLTAILLLFELTGNYQVILPVMIAVGICIWVLEQVKAQQSVRGLNLQQMGIDVEKPHAYETLQQVPVSAIMDCSYLALPAHTPLWEAGWQMVQKKCPAALVVNAREEMVGILTLGDVRRHLQEINLLGEEGAVLDSQIERLCTTDILSIHDSQSVAEAWQYMGNRGIYLLPVVDPHQPHRAIGVVERHLISLAVDLAETEGVLRSRQSP